ACLRAQQTKLYHLGIHGKVSRNTLAHANSVRDWRIYADFAQVLITRARVLYADDSFGVELAQTVYALDATTIDLCLALFPWAKFRKHKGAVKLHTPARPARQHSNCGDHYTWQDSRGQYSGSTQLRGRRVLCNGSRLPRFRSLVQVALGLRLLCYPRQKALRLPPPLFTTSGSSYRSDLRSDGYPRQSCPAPGLSREVTSHSLLRCPNKSATRLSNQQLQLATTDYCPTVSQPLAGRVVLQMDQATSAH